jgi:BON domain-containing protein
MSTAPMPKVGRMSVGQEPRAEVGFSRGARVFCTDDRRPVGRVEGWLTTPEQGQELLVRSGWWEPLIRRVPSSDIAWADSRAVQLSLDRQQFLKRQLYLPDEELQLAVYESLRTFSPLRYTTIRYTPFRSVAIQVHHGIVRLSGHVANELHRREAVQRAAATPGVLHVEDGLVTDEQLVSAVALAMLPHRELQPSRVRISASLGKVVLEGELDSTCDVELATAVAAAVPGATSVESRLCAVEEQVPAHTAPSPEPNLVMIEPGEACPPWRYAGELVLRRRPPASWRRGCG